jgi:hypothetical protein
VGQICRSFFQRRSRSRSRNRGCRDRATTVTDVGRFHRFFPVTTGS